MAVTPQGQAGAERLKEWWASPEGQARWAKSPHPWTKLRDELIAHMVKNGEDPASAARKAPGEATNIFMRVFHHGPGSDVHRVETGHKPRGKVIGPG
jgi:hypothetical protein